MKTLAYGLILLASNASAATLGEVCTKMPIPMMQVECMAQGATGAQFSPRALSACARITDNLSNFGMFACVIAIKDRAYSDAEISQCDNLTDIPSTLNCFRSLGRKAANGGGISLVAIRSDVESALNMLYRGDSYEAREQLQFLSRKLGQNEYGRCE